ncbi:methyltransferase [Mariprofundus erugo]|uniref:methyltransferase n=1 Tax=Mariprofundus erugo TaxID=2528639 RepID=UPI0010FF00AA|nr:methyltransferase [Mariprofundus erugo]
MTHMPYDLHLQQLDEFLVEHSSLWQPQPFKTTRPAWCFSHPELTQALLDLDDATLHHYESCQDACIAFISAWLPPLAQISTLTALPESGQTSGDPVPVHLNTGMPGRKWQQISALYRSMKNPHQAITEWCGGKGYLGRLLSTQWQQPVTTLEIDLQLIRDGITLATKHKTRQQFRQVDVCTDACAPYLDHHYPVALHACGDLHRELVKRLAHSHTTGFSIVPCCYHLGQAQRYTPLNHHLQLNISREELRLAVNETVTARHHEIEKRDQDSAWKLAFHQLRQSLVPMEYKPFKPVPKAWLNDGFESYCRKLSAREKLYLPAATDFSHWEQIGYQRRHEVVRLQLLRHCFKRVLELWLVMDMAVYLEAHGYFVNISTFCDRTLTPRNILLQGAARP